MRDYFMAVVCGIIAIFSMKWYRGTLDTFDGMAVVVSVATMVAAYGLLLLRRRWGR